MQTNDIKNHLAAVRATLARRLASAFIVYTAILAAAFALAFFTLPHVDVGKYMIACDVSSGKLIDRLHSAVLSQSQSSVLLVVIYVSAYSSLSPAIGAIASAWRGFCLGAAVTMISSGSVGGIGETWRASVMIYFISTLFVIAEACVASFYSGVLTYSYGTGERLICRSLAAEHTKCFLMISGAAFLIGCVSSVFI